MPQPSYDRELLTRYFLGVASAAERKAVEEKYFSVDTSLKTFLRAEDEVIDDYVRGALTESERVLFERNFLCTAARRQRLEFTKSLVGTLAGTESDQLSASDQEALGSFGPVTGRSQEEAQTGGYIMGTPQSQRDLDYRPELFASLLAWLDPVRERAAKKYETIRVKLIRMFLSRGRVDAEELADEAINRVASRVSRLMETYVGDQESYFAQEAHYMLLGSSRAQARDPMPGAMTIEEAQPGSGHAVERAHRCLEKCLGQLSEENRELILQYYASEKTAKIGDRKDLAQSLGIPLNTLRIRVHRIRTSLQKCVTSCIQESE